MKNIRKLLVGLALIFVATLSCTGAHAQTQELRAVPQPQNSLWSTIIWTDDGTRFALTGSPDEACRLQWQTFQPLAEYRPPVYWNDVVWMCDYSVGVVSTATIVTAYCPPNHVPRQGLCVLDRLVPPVICNGECGQSPISGTPQPNKGNPINVNSGLKVQIDKDYESADGLLTVERQYLSRVGHGWQLLMPGFLELGGQNSENLTYFSRSGGKDDFFATNAQDDNTWTFAVPATDFYNEKPSRRRLTMVTTPSVGRATFANDANVSATTPAEMRLDMANGEYILFRRANGAPQASGGRRLVPVEQGKVGGYKLFDYNDAGYHPYRVRDSLNREMQLTWIDAPGPTVHPGISGSKVISQIVLPDTTRLDYTYDNASLSYTVPVPDWATQAGLVVQSTVPGSIKVAIDGRKDRMLSVTRRSASGSILWQRQFDYEYKFNPSAMTRVRDQNGATLAEYTYVGRELLASSKLAGQVNAFNFEHYEVYNDNWLSTATVRRVITPLGRTEDYWLNRRADTRDSQPASLTSIAASATPTTPAAAQTFVYNNGYTNALYPTMTKSIDELGRETDYSVDIANGRPTTITQAAGTPLARQSTVQWHPVLDLPTRVERDGLRVETTYTVDAMVASQTITDLTGHTTPYPTNGLSRTTTYTWGPNARLLSVNGPRAIDGLGRDDTTTFTYDTAGNVLTMTNGFNHITSFSGYDANGRPASMTDPNGVITQFVYDILGRTINVRVKHPTTATLDAITSFSYDVEGRVKSITAPASTALTMNYDLAGLLKSVVASNGERIDYSHDAAGNVTSQVSKRTNGSAANTITNTFDALGRLLTEALGANRRWTYSYDKVGNLTGSVSPLNQSTAHSFDTLNRLVSSALPDTGAPTNAYDPRDGVIEHRDPLGVRTTFVRNGFGEAIQEVSPERGTSVYYYNNAGDKTASVDGRGQRIDFAYDILGRLLTATPTANPATTYTWDTAVIAGSFAKGRLSSVVDGTTTIEYKYDHRGNVLTKRQRIDTGSWMELAFTYDLADRRTQITYPSGRIVNYTFDTLGRVTQVRTKASVSVTAWTTLASGMTYEAFGAITRANYGNGTRMIQSWGNDGRLANRRLELSATSVRLSSFTYSYDNNDNFTAIADTLDATKSRTYAYDAMDRLSRITGAPAPFAREDYIHDKNGNRLAVERRTTATTVPATQTDTYSIAANTNRLTSLTTTAGTYTYTHDGRGNQSVEQWPDGSVIMVSFDGFARLTRYKVGLATQAMLYNGEDERIRVVTTPAVGPSDTRIYMYDLDHRIVGEYGAAGVTDVKAEYIWTLPEVDATGWAGGDDGTGGYMPLAIVTGTTPAINWVHSHHNAKPILLTNAIGTVVAYGPHAVLGFPGQFANAVGLAGAQYYYNRYRDYNDATGRYIQADPIGLAGDANPYAYGMGNTLRYSDPEGLEGVSFFHPRDRISSTASMLVGARGGNFYVAGHGAKGRIFDQSRAGGPNDWGSRATRYDESNVSAFVARLRRAGLRPGQIIVLAGCNIAEDGGRFAMALAKAAGSPVYATDDFVAFPTSGPRRTVFPRPVSGVGAYGTGEWRLYTPTRPLVNRRPDVIGVATDGNTNTPIRRQ